MRNPQFYVSGKRHTDWHKWHQWQMEACCDKCHLQNRHPGVQQAVHTNSRKRPTWQPSSTPRHASGAYNQRVPQHGVNQQRNSSGRQVTYPQKNQPNWVFHSMNRGLSDGHRSYVNALNSNNECCVFCGEINHRSWSCKHGLPIKCFTCEADGHKSRFCPGYNE